NGSLFVSCDGAALGALQEDFPEAGEGSGYAREFLFQSRTLLLKLLDYRLNQGFWHWLILSFTNWISRRFGLFSPPPIPVCGSNPALGKDFKPGRRMPIPTPMQFSLCPGRVLRS